LPEPLTPSAQLTLSIHYYFVNSLDPLPAAIEQDDKQYLTYSFSAYTPTPYTTENQKTKVKFPNTDIPEYTETSDLKEGPDPERQGSTLTYGPYKTADEHPSSIMPVTVRYEFTKPVIRCTLLERDIEVSHWGGNLAVEDRFWLQNDGASLLKQFSRVSYAMKIYTNAPSTAVKTLKFPLKPGSVDPYFTDDIGNVSTSKFRPGQGKRDGLLELRPRYPIYGDWKYSFKIGWNNALSSFLRSAADQSYVLKVPFLEGPSAPEGVQYDKMDVRVILPEGASNVQFEVAGASGLPNDISSELGLFKTYLDTIGRTVLKVSATKVTDEARDSQLIVRLFTLPPLTYP
jgi:oligosaccharyltransferase complex subunit alpha (ribophorin I)